MNAAQLGREFLRPLSDQTILIAIVSFAALVALARAAGLFGLWLMIITLPAFCHFLVEVMQAQIEERPVAAPGIESFTLVESIWKLLPLVQIVLAVAAIDPVADRLGAAAAALTALIAGLLLPASFGLLGLTHSAAAAVDPRNIARLVGDIGPRYLLPVALCAAVVGVPGLWQRGALPATVLQVAGIYLLFALFTLTGALVARSGARDRVGGPQPAAPDPDALRHAGEQQREAVLSHAYGLVSRGYVEGGLGHIEEFIRNTASDGETSRSYDWFFQRMMGWENTDAGLLLAQRLLHRFVGHNARDKALKLLSRCYHENPAFHPLPEDRATLLRFAAVSCRDDLKALLERNTV